MGEPARTQEVAIPDPTYYPTTDNMGEDALQAFIVELLRPLIARFLAHQGVRAFVGADQFIYWVQHAPTVSVAPDIYVLPGVSPDIAPRCWKVWEQGVVPSFALEVMAEENTKDLILSPRRYDELGVRELIMFDPYADQRRDPVRFWVYRRKGKGEFLPPAEVTNGDRVRSSELGAYIRVVGSGDAQRLRLGTGPKGRILFPTEAEEQAVKTAQERVKVEQERARAERERAKTEQEHAKALQEQQRAEAAEAEVLRLRALLEKLQKS